MAQIKLSLDEINRLPIRDRVLMFIRIRCSQKWGKLEPCPNKYHIEEAQAYFDLGKEFNLWAVD